MAIHKDTQGPAPDGFHIPTKDEWGALCWILTTTLGLSSNWNTMKTYLKMPFAGYRYCSSAGVNSQGSSGYYWSSSHYDANNAYRLYFPPTALRPQDSEYRAHGYSVRCFKDSPVAPSDSWTTLYDGGSVATGAWVFHNATLWLISVSGDGTTWYTIQDKNLWATTVYNDWDTLSEANCGWYFQWWNNYMFPRTWTIENQSTTQVDASAYWPWDYYSSDTFIKYNWRWDSTDNWNLRWWETNWTRWHLDIRQHWAIQTFHRAPKPPTSITLNESAIIFSAVWDTQQLTATVSPGDAAKDFIWSSNDTSIATVSDTWLVTCVSLWNCVITCSAKYWSATASCSVINPENVTMTNTSYSLDSTYTSLTTTLFTASKTWYYHITWTFWARSQAGGATWATHSLSWWEYKSWTNSWWTDPGRSIAVDCVYYIEAWTELKWYVETYWYTSWWWSNFAAVYYWSYDPTS